MKKEVLAIFKELFPEGKEGEILAPYTTFQIGGPADFFVVIKEKEQFVKAISTAREHNVPVFILGGGSNVLVSSEGFQGLVIKNEMRAFRVEGDSIIAESGTVLASVIKVAKDNGLMGIAKLQGVPGSFGAAVRGNVGVPDCEIGDFVTSATILCENGEIKTVDREYFEYGYRISKLKKNKEIILEATIKLTPGGEPAEIQEEMMSTLKMRKAKQPWGKSGGSYFKNPSKEKAAGFLLDQIGAKEQNVGAAAISEKHANFFLNKGQATSYDVQDLADKVKKKVLMKFGILLEEEVEFIGKKKYNRHIHQHPVIKIIIIIILIILGIIGVIFPIMPGVVFFFLAIYIAFPERAAQIIRSIHFMRDKVKGKKE